MHEKYFWLNWQTARQLAANFDVSKRRILQVISDLRKELLCVEATIVFSTILSESQSASKVYMRLDKDEVQ